ncbi:MAG: trypsin-like peptidase domain-containing protein [Chloroflexi bacterium]|nr:trypsin-like peptidase domain-containing protein [Chloroflexota bacterium]
MRRSRMVLFLVGLLVVAGVLFAGRFAIPLIGTGARVAALDNAAQRIFTSAAPAAAQQAVAVAQSAAAPTVAPAVTINVQPGADDESQILEAVYQKVNPSVVQVVNLARNSRLRNSVAVPQGEGSGFVWDKQGHIVTNDHVVSGADQLQVVFPDGTTLDAQLVGTDPNSDIAVIKVDPQLATLVPVAVGDMTQVHVGEMAIAIGNPFGLEGTMTRGIVSALGRTIPSQTSFSIPEAIQTDAAINPGNSGGPLLNEWGQVIGVNDQIQSSTGSNSGVGFAIPISIVQRVVPALIQNGTYEHAYLGLSGGTYSKAWSQALGLPADLKGIYVLGISANGPAARAGLRAGNTDSSVVLGTTRTGATYLQSGGDLITAIDGQPVSRMDDLLIYLEEKTSPGQTVQLTVLRDGQQQTLSVKLEARSATTGA